ncbi:MAG: helix-turn-helix domain-containing protein [Candidatus Woesearchaeota archaeon]
MDTSILEEIGLTGAEIKVFLSLIELGSSAAGKVVEKSGLQNAVVHRAFHSLSEKGLITYIKEGKVKHYQTIEPKHLLNFIDEKRARLEKILPELEAKKGLAKQKPQATMFQGVRGVKELISIMLDTDTREYFSYGSPQKSHDLLGNFFWENFQRKRVEKKIKAQLLFHSSLKWWADELNKKYKLTHVKTTKRNFEEMTETIICGKRVAIIIYLDKPFGFLIEEQLAANSYKKFFDILWETATI